jgi:hypothetical protein
MRETTYIICEYKKEMRLQGINGSGNTAEIYTLYLLMGYNS